MDRKGIILAGGSGTRLYPITKAVSKQLLPIYDKPMIYYPLSMLMLAGIREVMIISTPEDLPLFKRLLGSGEELGMRFVYAEQPSPDGLAQALIIAEEFLAGAPSCLVLGDNLFFGHDLSKLMQAADQQREGATVFGYPVADPERYGVVEFNPDGKVVSIEEKPVSPKSNYAVPGIYFYDEHAPRYAREQKPSSRGELEITDLNIRYLDEGNLRVQLFGRGTAWLDTGTHDSFAEATQFVEVIQKRQGLQIGCIEEIAWRQGFIGNEQLRRLGQELGKSGYGEYILCLLNA
ncbi:MAG TPA: glucose-1-phosphate thymidylyltransferase RfbA [Opitutales bacterium]|nr:glucose-1-phosphate thymidylyltransferase RfbA [Opitutales bacterium]